MSAIDRFNDMVASAEVTKLTGAQLADFIASPGLGMVLLASDPARQGEAIDLVVVMRELRRSDPTLRTALVEPADVLGVMASAQVIVLPSLVVCGNGSIHNVLPRIQDWTAYTRALGRLQSAA
ncbi:MAG: hypothetical protein SF002_04225 [Alphaproteobacteria bacterium]|nr:hypothetical protein [Alphaproteobacteria bacterium]